MSFKRHQNLGEVKKEEVKEQPIITLFPNSPLTKAIFQASKNLFFSGTNYGVHGFVFSAITTMSLACHCSPIKAPFYIVAQTGMGKTIQMYLASGLLEKFGHFIESWDKHIDIYKDWGGTTFSALSRMFAMYEMSLNGELQGKEIPKDIEKDVKMLKQAEDVLWEDLARVRPETKIQTVCTLTDMPYKTVVTYRTADTVGKYSGGKINIETTKRVQYASTLRDYAIITLSDEWSEFISRRTQVFLIWFSPEEWKSRIMFAENLEETLEDEKYIDKWIDEISRIHDFTKIPILVTNDRNNVVLDKSSRDFRLKAKKFLMPMKPIPESANMFVDSIAYGHALMNGRKVVLPEDYLFILLIVRRFIELYDMIGKSALIFNQFCRVAKKANGTYQCSFTELEEAMRILFAEMKKLENKSGFRSTESQAITTDLTAILSNLPMQLDFKYEEKGHHKGIVYMKSQVVDIIDRWNDLLSKMNLI